MSSELSDEVGDELLPGASTWRYRLAVLGLAVIVIVFGVLALTRHQRSTPHPLVVASTSSAPSAAGSLTPPPIAATDALVPGLETEMNSGGGTSTYSADLVNDTDTTLTVSGEVVLRGPGDTGVPGARATITTSAAAARYLSLVSGAWPLPLTQIHARQTVSLLVSFHELCKGLHRAWPAEYPHIIVTLVGYTQPALFDFNELFDSPGQFVERAC